MELLGLKFLPFLTTIGKDIIIKSITTTAQSIISISNSIKNNTQSSLTQIKNELDLIDINNSAHIICNLVSEQSDIIMSSDKNNMPNSLKRAIIGVNEILTKIEDELNIIYESINHHETKYFKNWRKFDCKCNIDSIKKYELILFKRYKLLKDTIMINMSNKITCTNNVNQYINQPQKNNMIG